MLYKALLYMYIMLRTEWLVLHFYTNTYMQILYKN